MWAVLTLLFAGRLLGHVAGATAPTSAWTPRQARGPGGGRQGTESCPCSVASKLQLCLETQLGLPALPY